MEVFLAIVALGIIGYFFWTNTKKAADLNEDGKVDVADAKVAVAKIEDAIVSEAKEVSTELVKTVEAQVEAVAVKLEEEIKVEVEKVAEEVKVEVEQVVTKAKETVKKVKAKVVRNSKKKK